MYLRKWDGKIVEVPKKKLLRSLFCNHLGVEVSGIHCSKNGLARISGRDYYTVCMNCGKVLNEWHVDYER